MGVIMQNFIKIGQRSSKISL